MSRKAIDALDDAVQATRDLLLPFDKDTWLRLMVIVLFAGGAMSFPSFPSIPADAGNAGYSTGTDYSTAGVESVESAVSGLETRDFGALTGAATSSPNTVATAAAAVVLASIAGLMLILLWLSSVFQFVYYQSLIDEKVRIRPNLKKHARNGLHYMIFRIIVTLAMGALLLGAFGGFFVNPILGVLLFLLLLPLFLIVVVASGLINNLAVPEMVKQERGLVDGIKQVFRMVKSDWAETGIYVFLRFATGLVISVGVFTTAMMLLIVFLLFFGLLAAGFYMLHPLLGIIVGVVAVVLYMVSLLAVRVPIRTFMYFYAIRFYEEL